MTSIEQFMPKPSGAFRLFVTIQVIVKEHNELNRIYSGYVQGYVKIKEFMNNIKKRHNLEGTIIKITRIAKQYSIN